MQPVLYIFLYTNQFLFILQMLFRNVHIDNSVFPPFILLVVRFTVHFMIVVKSMFLKTMLNLFESILTIKRLNENLIAQKYFVIC